MLGILIQLGISWILLRYIEKSSLSSLGILPTKERALFFVSGLALAGLGCATYNLISTAFVSNAWVVNRDLSSGTSLVNTWLIIKSVLFEELLFRGALLFIAIRRIGEHKANLFSAICFGIYHWFSYNVLGNVPAMIFVFIITGVAGLAFAYAFSRTKSIYFPVALHLGWNLVHIGVFSNGPYGQGFLYKMNDVKPEGMLSLSIFTFQLLILPSIVWLQLRTMRGRSEITDNSR